MVLTRQCADVSMLMYHMRTNGDVLDHDLLASGEQLPAPVSASHYCERRVLWTWHSHANGEAYWPLW